MSQFFASSGQNLGVSDSASVFPMNIQNWFPLGLTGLIPLQGKGLSRVFSNTTVQKHRSSGVQLSLWSNSHIHTWLLGKIIALTLQTFVSKEMSSLFNKLSRFVIAFLQGASVFNFMASFTICGEFGAQENKVSHCFHCVPIYWLWSDGTGCHDLNFLSVEFQASFFILLSHFHQETL